MNDLNVVLMCCKLQASIASCLRAGCELCVRPSLTELTRYDTTAHSLDSKRKYVTNIWSKPHVDCSCGNLHVFLVLCCCLLPCCRLQLDYCLLLLLKGVSLPRSLKRLSRLSLQNAVVRKHLCVNASEVKFATASSSRRAALKENQEEAEELHPAA